MTAAEICAEFDRDGFVILPRFFGPEEVCDAVADLPSEFPTADEFHSDADPARNRRFRDEFGGITAFPVESMALDLLSVHPRLVDLATALLGEDDLRGYSIEFWAKYTGAADYDQPFHRDYLNHTVLVPSADAPASQVEMFVYLSDVTEDLGPIALLPRRYAPDPPALPNWYPAFCGQLDEEHPGWVSPTGRPGWYEHEVKATGPAGTVIVYRIDTFHRGPNLARPGGADSPSTPTSARRPMTGSRGEPGPTERTEDPRGQASSPAASPNQLRLFGFPPPGHAYWTDATLDGVAERYPGFDPEPWR